MEVAARVVWGVCVGGELPDIILERGDSKLFKMLSSEFWVGYLVKLRRYLTSTAASSKGGAHWWKWCGDGSMCDIGCVCGGGGCLISFWKEGTPSYSKCYHRGFGWDIW
jgi:hypothetical protein